MNHSSSSRVAVVVLGLLCLNSIADAQPTTPDAKGLALFESKIRPVLIKECYSCHSAEAAKNKKLRGSLQLDTREGTLKGGDSGPAVVPGDPKKSLLLLALKHDDNVEKMPPRGKLPDDVIADFAKWIDLGAPDPRDGSVLPAKRSIDIAEGKKFWSFRPLAVVPPPSVKTANWARNPIDQFLLAGLEAKSLKPSKPLPKEQLIRRVTIDLTGLPPTAEEVAAFVNDTAPDAYETLLNRLLASDRFGERWGRHWLDAVRFAESGGYEFDGDRQGAFHYRDFVIKALNADMPFDEFVRLQLAGDELKPNDMFATSATGFLVAGPYPGQTTQKTLAPIRYDHLDDMITTTSSAFLGLTMGCSRCHDHKYDPIPQQDYYRLIAALGRTDSMTRQMDADPEAFRKLKATFDATHAPLVQTLAAFEKDTLPGRFEKWLATEKAKPSTPWLSLEPASVKGKATFKRLDDGSYLASGKVEKGDAYTIAASSSLTKIAALRVEAMPDASLPKSGPGRSPEGTFKLSEITLTATPNAEAAKKGTKPVAVKFKPGKTSGPVTAGMDHAATFIAETPFGVEGGATLSIVMKFDNDFAAGRFRLAFSTNADAALDASSQSQVGPEILSLLAAQEGKLDGKYRAEIVRWFRKVDAATEEAFATVERSLAKEPKPPLQPVFSATSGRGGDVHFLIRGETERKNGVASPGFVQVLFNTDENRWLREKVDKASESRYERALSDMRAYEAGLAAKQAAWESAESANKPVEWTVVEPSESKSQVGATFTKQDDKSLLVGGPNGKDVYTLTLPTDLTGITGVRIEALPHSNFQAGGSGRAPDGNFVLSEVKLSAASKSDPSKVTAIPLTSAVSDFSQDNYNVAGAIDGNDATGWAIAPRINQPHVAHFETGQDVGVAGGTLLTIELRQQFKSGQHSLGRFRLSITTAKRPFSPSRLPPEITAVLAVAPGQRSPQQTAQLATYFRSLDGQLARLKNEVERAAGPAKLPRVALGDWLTDDKQGAGHLLARVIVNRLWQHHFGKGLVRTPNDFGIQGEPPTHPELLDFLAAELIQGGWKLKPIHKLIMLSAAYQQGRDVNEAATKADPQNRLWWSVPPRRLEAEAIRDGILAIGGSLDLKMYGAGTLDENSPRRSVYLTVKRSRLLPMLQAYDSPEPIQSVGERPQTTATTQALMMMNSRLVRQQAEKLAKVVLPASAADVPASVEKAYRTVLSRMPTATERTRMTDFIHRSAENQGAKGLETATADFCQVLLCLNEFLYVD